MANDVARPVLGTTWHRAIDDKGRLFTLAIDGDRVAIYYPDLAEKEFVIGSRLRTESFGDIPVRYWREEYELGHLDEFKRGHCIVGQVEATMAPGYYFPRVYRGSEHPPIDVPARTATMRAARSLFSRLRGAFQLVEPTHAHDAVFGHELR